MHSLSSRSAVGGTGLEKMAVCGGRRNQMHHGTVFAANKYYGIRPTAKGDVRTERSRGGGGGEGDVNGGNVVFHAKTPKGGGGDGGGGDGGGGDAEEEKEEDGEKKKKKEKKNNRNNQHVTTTENLPKEPQFLCI